MRLMKFFAVTAKGIEPVTAQELTHLGATRVEPGYCGVHFEGDLETVYRANLWLRTASRILMPIREFAASSQIMLYDQVRRVHWEDWLNPQTTFAVYANDQALKIKDAIVDRLRLKYGS